MSSSGQYRYDYANAVNVTVAATTSTVALPANRELFAVTSDCNARWRTGPAGGAAVATDPLITPSVGPVIVRIATGATAGNPDTNAYAIGDPATPNTGLVSFCPVFED